MVRLPFFHGRKQHKSSTAKVPMRWIPGFEFLEQRTMLALTAPLAVSNFDFDPGWLAPTDSEEYVQAIIRERERLGWTIETPRLLENGNWYLGPAGERKVVIIPTNVNAADTTNTDQLRSGEIV